MPIYDISLPISASLPVWPGAPRANLTQLSHLAEGDRVTKHVLTTDVHTGTHVDAPSHFLLDGANVDVLDLNVLVGPALVVEALDVDLLSADVLQGLAIPRGTQRVLFHTRNSDRWARGEREFSPDYVGIADDGARWLVERGVRLVGVDYLAVAPYSDTGPTHRTLLGAGVIVVEALDLSGITPGIYQLVCLPLRIAGIEGAPARAILMDADCSNP